MFNVFSFYSYRIDLSKLIEKMDDSFVNEKLILESILKNSFANLNKVDINAIDNIYVKSINNFKFRRTYS
jgi:hypothetical protein